VNYKYHTPKDCTCGGEGHHTCHDTFEGIGTEGYSVDCEDCGKRSIVVPTWDEATEIWNQMNQTLHEVY